MENLQSLITMALLYAMILFLENINLKAEHFQHFFKIISNSLFKLSY